VPQKLLPMVPGRGRGKQKFSFDQKSRKKASQAGASDIFDTDF